jgi:hypothetical protein
MGCHGQFVIGAHVPSTSFNQPGDMYRILTFVTSVVAVTSTPVSAAIHKDIVREYEANTSQLVGVWQDETADSTSAKVSSTKCS